MWQTFFFDSNMFFDNIKGPEDWHRLRTAYPYKSDDELLAAREATYRGTRPQDQRDEWPNYGFRSEHDGERTLKDHFIRNDMMDLIPTRILQLDTLDSLCGVESDRDPEE